MGNLTKKAVMDAVLDFCKNLTDTEVCELQGYLMYGYFETAPNEIQENFTEEFFGALEWAEFIHEMKMEKKPFFTNVKPTKYLLHDIKVYMSYESHKRLEKVLKDSMVRIAVDKIIRSDDKVTKLQNRVKKIGTTKNAFKKELKQAIKDSYYDGVFDKCDGWCNTMDVLMKYNLLKETDFND